MFQLSNINNVAYILFEMFGDTLDRMMFVIENFELKQYNQLYKRLDQMECNCYFIQCVVQLQYHVRTFNKTWIKGNYK